MALSGSLQDFSIPDVFRLISLSGKTGVLHLSSDKGEGSVWFREGQIFFAQSDRRRGVLGERLVSAGRITAADLGRAIVARESEPEDGRRIGQILVDQGSITSDVLVDFVQEQIQDTVFDLFLWDEGSFIFEALGSPPEDQDIGLAVSIENIVMEGARRLSEWKNLRTSAAAGGVIFRVGTVTSEHVVDIALKPSEWRVVTLADGTRTVAEIAAVAGVAEAEAARTLYGLFGAGLLQIVDETPPAGASSPARPAVAETVEESDPTARPLADPIPAAEPQPAAERAGTPVADAVAEQDDPDERYDSGADDALESPDLMPDLEQAAPPAGLVLEMGGEGERMAALREPEQASRAIWAGIGSEVAALTGAEESKSVKSAPSRPATGSITASRRIRWDGSITRDDIVLIHAAIKAL